MPPGATRQPSIPANQVNLGNTGNVSNFQPITPINLPQILPNNGLETSGGFPAISPIRPEFNNLQSRFPNIDIFGSPNTGPEVGKSIGADGQPILPNTGFFDEGGGSRFLIPGLEALTGVANFFNSKDLIDLGRDQFNLSKNQSNRDFNSQAQVFNTNLRSDRSNFLSNTAAFDTSTPEGQAKFDAALDAYVKENSIDSSTI